MIQKRERSPTPFSGLYDSFYVTGSLVHDHFQSTHVANKICLSYVKNIPKVMGLACGTFVVSYLKTLDMPFLRLFFPKTEDRNQPHRDHEAVYNT